MKLALHWLQHTKARAGSLLLFLGVYKRKIRFKKCKNKGNNNNYFKKFIPSTKINRYVFMFTVVKATHFAL